MLFVTTVWSVTTQIILASCLCWLSYSQWRNLAAVLFLVAELLISTVCERALSTRVLAFLLHWHQTFYSFLELLPTLFGEAVVYITNTFRLFTLSASYAETTRPCKHFYFNIHFCSVHFCELGIYNHNLQNQCLGKNVQYFPHLTFCPCLATTNHFMISIVLCLITCTTPYAVFQTGFFFYL